MLILGIVLIILGLLFGIPLLWIIGLVLALLGVVFLFAPPGGRRWY